MGLTVAALEDEIPLDWGQPYMTRDILLEKEPMRVARYPHGLITLSEDEEIIMIIALEDYRGMSARGITIGSSQYDLLDQYRIPSRTLALTYGESWVYEAHSVSFQLRHGKVVSWTLF